MLTHAATLRCRGGVACSLVVQCNAGATTIAVTAPASVSSSTAATGEWTELPTLFAGQPGMYRVGIVTASARTAFHIYATATAVTIIGFDGAAALMGYTEMQFK